MNALALAAVMGLALHAGIKVAGVELIPSGCVRYYYKTTVTLEQNCPAPNEKLVTRLGERVTSTGPHCADGSGKIPPPVIEARVLSSGDMPDGKHQDIVLQPDGTRITLQYDPKTITVTAGFPDGTADSLSLP